MGLPIPTQKQLTNMHGSNLWASRVNKDYKPGPGLKVWQSNYLDARNQRKNAYFLVNSVLYDKLRADEARAWEARKKEKAIQKKHEEVKTQKAIQKISKQTRLTATQIKNTPILTPQQHNQLLRNKAITLEIEQAEREAAIKKTEQAQQIQQKKEKQFEQEFKQYQTDIWKQKKQQTYGPRIDKLPQSVPKPVPEPVPETKSFTFKNVVKAIPKIVAEEVHSYGKGLKKADLQPKKLAIAVISAPYFTRQLIKQGMSPKQALSAQIETYRLINKEYVTDKDVQQFHAYSVAPGVLKQVPRITKTGGTALATYQTGTGFKRKDSEQVAAGLITGALTATMFKRPKLPKYPKDYTMNKMKAYYDYKAPYRYERVFDLRPTTKPIYPQKTYTQMSNTARQRYHRRFIRSGLEREGSIPTKESLPKKFFDSDLSKTVRKVQTRKNLKQYSSKTERKAFRKAIKKDLNARAKHARESKRIELKQQLEELRHEVNMQRINDLNQARSTYLTNRLHSVTTANQRFKPRLSKSKELKKIEIEINKIYNDRKVELDNTLHYLKTKNERLGRSDVLIDKVRKQAEFDKLKFRSKQRKTMRKIYTKQAGKPQTAEEVFRQRINEFKKTYKTIEMPKKKPTTTSKRGVVQELKRPELTKEELMKIEKEKLKIFNKQQEQKLLDKYGSRKSKAYLEKVKQLDKETGSTKIKFFEQPKPSKQIYKYKQPRKQFKQKPKSKVKRYRPPRTYKELKYQSRYLPKAYLIPMLDHEQQQQQRRALQQLQKYKRKPDQRLQFRFRFDQEQKSKQKERQKFLPIYIPKYKSEQRPKYTFPVPTLPEYQLKQEKTTVPVLYSPTKEHYKKMRKPSKDESKTTLQFTPILKDKFQRTTNTGLTFTSPQAASAEAMHIVDETPYTAFKIKAVYSNRRPNVPRKHAPKHKFYKRTGHHIERAAYRNDKERSYKSKPSVISLLSSY